MPGAATRRKAGVKALASYDAKRDFSLTPEPKGGKPSRSGNIFIVQRHDARREHYDLRLELDGVLKSWAVTRGPSAQPSTKRLAVRTEDHPIDYAEFEGVIPPKQYGAGTVMLWDSGTWDSIDGDPREGLEKGSLKFALTGKRMKGEWALVRMKDEGKRENWLLIKHRDAHAESDDRLIERHDTSVETGRTLADIAAGRAAKKRKPARQTAAAKPKSTTKSKAEKLQGAKDGKRVAFPRFVPPQLCDSRKTIPPGEGWIAEMKYDGYRLQLQVAHGQARVLTRSGLDWSEKFRPIVAAGSQLPVTDAILDGEAVVFDDSGISDFKGLVQSLDVGAPQGVFQAFDLLRLDGEDLRKQELLDRKLLLEKLVARAPPAIRYSEHVDTGLQALLDRILSADGEGVIVKKADAPYRSGRTSSWIKVKGDTRLDVFIVGWRPSDRGRPFASLHCAKLEGAKLRLIGGIGTGFSQNRQKQIMAELTTIARKSPPPALIDPENAPTDICWVDPLFEAEAAIAGWTGEGNMRHARFIDMKQATRKPSQKNAAAKKAAAKKPAAKKLAAENPAAKKRAAKKSDSKKSAARKVATARARTTKASPRTPAADGKAQPPKNAGKLPAITSRERVVFPKQGITKGEVADYYAKVATKIAPFLENRPVSIVRAPDGLTGQLFFQRHPMKGMTEGLKPFREGKKTYFALDGQAGLCTFAQFGGIELHGWGATLDALDYPDRVIFDLDPADDVPFERVIEVARQFRNILAAAGLDSFALVSGGKGVHVVLPLDRSQDWDTIKQFSSGLARHLAATDPSRLIAVANKARRKGKIFIDWLRNTSKATAIVPYSLRARDTASVAMPVSWRELGSIKSGSQFTMADALRRKTAWPGYEKARRAIPEGALRMLA
jgi:bifunctional non-homologous end joining protein LigD